MTQFILKYMSIQAYNLTHHQVIANGYLIQTKQ